MKKIPVILDTDIGGDIDDTWALGMLLKSPELDVKLVTTATGDTVYRAKIVAKFLESAGRSDIPIGIGIRQNSDGPRERQAKWVENYDLKNYPGKVYEDGVSAILNTIESIGDTVSLICIGPLPNIAEAIRKKPDFSEKVNFVGMHGSFRLHHKTNLNLSPEKGPIPEWNVVQDIASAKTVFSSKWKSFTITPLDTCGWVVLDGELYQKCKNSNDKIMKMIIENYMIWSRGVNNTDPQTHSSVLFDTVAVFLAFSTKWLKMKKMQISVDDKGFTIEDKSGIPANVAMEWLGLEEYKKWLVERLLS
ncbi:MAG TPA: nucleoside hydrolase [Victivallales bacterium]|nr:nucleoside hydrolase [Victivallales bacterium]HPO89637.1 nucleoside hydrolase [Victivallales bacterium]HRR29037.1 nucleoside hydrolase [Victivallales bacterium]HRU00211.1 nucleoside hydrolase [Victivallales bacterium]